VLSILMQMAGYTMGKADIVRKAIGKKNRELMAQEEPRFITGCQQNGLTAEQAAHLWSLIQPFAGYSFNRAHSTLYGLLSYQTAYLKTNYSTEYMAALLSSAAGNAEDVARYVGESMRLGVAVLPPDVNHSDFGFTIEVLGGELPEGVTHRKGVRFGLSAIKNVGEGPIRAICAARAEGGPFGSLEDLCERVDRKELGKRVLESLIKSGALNSLPGTRRQKLAVLDQVVGAASEAQRMREAGQASMFDIFGAAETPGTSVRVQFPVIAEGPADHKEMLQWEKELLGMYITEHPVAQALADLPPDPNRLTLAMLSEAHVGQKVELVGMLTGLRKITTKKGDTMLTAVLEDLEGSIEMVAFPKAYEKFSSQWVEDTVVAVGGKIENRREALQLVCESIAPYTEAKVSTPAPVVAPVFATGEYAGLPAGFDDGFPGYDDGEPPAFDEAAWASASPLPPSAEQQPSNGNGSLSGNGYDTDNGNGHHTGNGAAHDLQAQNGAGGNGAPATQQAEQNGTGDGEGGPPAPPPAAATPITVVRPRQRIQIAKKEDESRPAAPAPSGPQYHLHVTINRTEDFDADVRCMQEVDRVLRRFVGQHKISLYIPRSDCIVVLEPLNRINPAPELIAALTELLGEGRVQLEGAS